VSPEQRASPSVLIQQTPHGQGNCLGLVTAGQLLGGLFDQGDNIWPVDGDNVWHDLLFIH
jgi:hypothetical protein